MFDGVSDDDVSDARDLYHETLTRCWRIAEQVGWARDAFLMLRSALANVGIDVTDSALVRELAALVIERYRDRIPADVHAAIVPSEGELVAIVAAVVGVDMAPEPSLD